MLITSKKMNKAWKEEKITKDWKVGMVYYPYTSEATRKIV